VVATAHKQFPYAMILRSAQAIVDTRNAFRGKKSAKITRL